MLRLYILRHAKSAWPAPSTGDHDRPLNKRGRGDLKKIATMLGQRNYIPELALCSPAERTQETWRGIAAALPDCAMETRAELYESNTSRYLEAIRTANGAASIMLIGHNPVCDDLTRLLITGDGPVAGEFLSTHYPTGTLVALDIPVEQWSEVSATTAMMVDFVRPRFL